MHLEKSLRIRLPVAATECLKAAPKGSILELDLTWWWCSIGIPTIGRKFSRNTARFLTSVKNALTTLLEVLRARVRQGSIQNRFTGQFSYSTWNFGYLSPNFEKVKHRLCLICRRPVIGYYHGSFSLKIYGRFVTILECIYITEPDNEDLERPVFWFVIKVRKWGLRLSAAANW